MTLPAYLALRSQVHSRVGRHSQSHLTIYSHVCSCVLDIETCWGAGARHREVWGRWRVEGGGLRVAGGGWSMVAEIMTSVNIIVSTLSLAQPPWRDLTMPHGLGVYNCSLRLCWKGRQLDLGESRSPTQIFQHYLRPASHWLWAKLCAFGPGLMVMMVMVWW